MKSSHLNGAMLVFDLDGTLVDTAPDLVRTLNHVLGGIGCRAVPADQMRPFISFGARRMLMEALALDGKALDEAGADRLFDRFLEHYGDNVAVESAPYPGVADALESALAAGARLGVCTNKRESLSRALLKELELESRFAAIVGRDTLDVHKPDPRHLTETIARAGGRNGKAVMIGDSPTDVATARNADIPVIAVSFGYSEVPPSELGADVLIDDYSELMPALDELLGS